MSSSEPHALPKAFSNGREMLNFTLEPHASATFRYAVLVLEGTATPDRLEREYNAFAAGQIPRSADGLARSGNRVYGNAGG